MDVHAYTVEHFYSGHPWDGKVSLIKREHVKIYIILMFGTAQAVLIREVSLFWDVMIVEVPLSRAPC